VTRVNLLRARPDRGPRADPLAGRRRAATTCTLLLAFTSCGVGVWAWEIYGQSSRLTRDIAHARQEISRLRIVVARAGVLGLASLDLQRRVDALEALRAAQRAPAREIDAIRLGLPDECWLTGITEEPAGAVRIEGRAAAVTSVFTFVDRLQGSGAFTGGVEVLETRATTDPGEDSIEFSLRAAHLTRSTQMPPATDRRPPQSSGRNP
jgi:Tfp pilus assembly protein PilN